MKSYVLDSLVFPSKINKSKGKKMASKNVKKTVKKVKSALLRLTIEGKLYDVVDHAAVEDENYVSVDGFGNWSNQDRFGERKEEFKEEDLILHLKPHDPMRGKTIIKVIEANAEGLQSLAELKNEIKLGDTIIVARNEEADEADADDEDSDEDKN